MRDMSRRRAAKRRQQLMRKYAKIAIVLVLIIAIVVVVARVKNSKDSGADDTESANVPELVSEMVVGTTTENKQDTADGSADDTADANVDYYTAHETDSTFQLINEVNSDYAIVIDEETGDILAEKNPRERMSPASMTKILTVLVAAEHIDPAQLDDTVVISQDAIDFAFANGCSNAGFIEGETVTVRDLFYATILPSGGEAAGQLAIYIAGSTEAFADMMNEKLAELGCGETSHFTNCVGIYGEDHYSTVYDIAMIMKAAMDNEICRPVLSAHVYTTTVTEQNPEGLICSNWFLRRIEDKMESGEVIGAKTGFVDQAGSCAASYEQSESGRTYICVTASANSSWSCIYDHVDLYKTFAQ